MEAVLSVPGASVGQLAIILALVEHKYKAWKFPQNHAFTNFSSFHGFQLIVIFTGGFE
jgi:hypothetical protein